MIPKADPFDALDEVVDRFGRSIGHAGAMPGDDLVSPSKEGFAITFEGRIVPTEQ